jgi:hypothetical protein
VRFLKNLFGGKPLQPNGATEFGPFAVVWRDGPGYLPLLHLSSGDVQPVLLAVSEALRSVPDDQDHIQLMLQHSDWRPHLVAAVAALLSRDPSNFAPSLWAAFDRGSWVAPQLAVALHFSDPDFVPQAKRRVVDRCTVAVSEGMLPPEGLLPFQRRERSAKNLASLMRVLSHVPSEATWVVSELAAGDVQALLKADVDSAGEIVDSWSEAARDQFAKYGRNLSPPA